MYRARTHVLAGCWSSNSFSPSLLLYCCHCLTMRKCCWHHQKEFFAVLIEFDVIRTKSIRTHTYILLAARGESSLENRNFCSLWPPFDWNVIDGFALYVIGEWNFSVTNIVAQWMKLIPFYKLVLLFLVFLFNSVYIFKCFQARITTNANGDYIFGLWGQKVAMNRFAKLNFKFFSFCTRPSSWRSE